VLRNEHSGSKHNVERGDVNESTHQQSFKYHTNCAPSVSEETLLAEGKSSCFAND